MKFRHALLPLLLSVFAVTAAPAHSQTEPASPASPIVIQVHAGQASGPYTPIWNFYGADEPNYIYAPYGQKLLRELAALSPVPVYFRAHNLLTTGNGERSLKWGSTNVYTESANGTPHYDFTITDRIFDALLADHVRPLVEIGFMPKALSSHPEPYRHDFPKGPIFTGWSYPPNNWSKWSISSSPTPPTSADATARKPPTGIGKSGTSLTSATGTEHRSSTIASMT